MFYNIIIVLIIPVYDSGFTASEQLGLAGEVFLKIFMFSWSNVVRRYIGEYTIIKFDPRHAVHLDPLGGNLHNHIFAAFLHHHGKQLLKLIGFRRRVLGGDGPSVHKSSHCADDPTDLSRFLDDIPHHVLGGRLALGSSNSHSDHFFRRIIKIGGGHKTQRFSPIFYQKNRNILIFYICLLFHHDDFCPCLYRTFDKVMAIHHSSLNRHKHSALYGFTGIIGDISHVLVQRPL